MIFFFLPQAFCGLKHAENVIAVGLHPGPADPAGGAHDAPPDLLVGYSCLYMLIKVRVNLVLRIYPSYGP